MNEDEEDQDPPMPPGFPAEDDFEGFICYKCVDANPWIKRYAASPGFLNPVFRKELPQPVATTEIGPSMSQTGAEELAAESVTIGQGEDGGSHQQIGSSRSSFEPAILEDYSADR